MRDLDQQEKTIARALIRNPRRSDNRISATTGFRCAPSAASAGASSRKGF